jgi:ADP-heptose:LPS heptosyltransferase
MPLKVLIIRLSAIGDVIHTLPLASEIKKVAPGAQVTWVVEQAASNLVQNNPSIDRVLIFPGKAAVAQIKSLKFGKPAWDQVAQFIRELRSESYDAAIDAQGLFKSAILTYMSGAKIRIGFAGAREFGDRFLTHPVDVGDYFGPDRPVVELNLQLAKKFQDLYKLAELGEVQAPKFVLPELSQEAVAKADLWMKRLQALPPGVPSATGAAPSGNSTPAPDTPLAPEMPLTPAATSIPGTEASPSTTSVPGAAASTAAPAVPAAAADRDSSLVPDMTPLSTSKPAPAMAPNRREPRDKHIHMNRSGGAAGPSTAVLVPGTTWDSKVWPLEHWFRLSERLIDELGLSLILAGGKSETATNTSLANQLRQSGRGSILDLTNQTSLLELQALFLQSDLVVGADTGPLHLAAATNVPKVVGIYGSTPWRRNGPYGAHCLTISLALDCQPCFKQICPLSTKACLIDMTPDYVFERIAEFLALHNRSPGPK